MPVVNCAIMLKSGDCIEFRGDVKVSYETETNRLQSLTWTVEKGEAPVWIDLDQVAAVITEKQAQPRPAPIMGAETFGRGILTATKVTSDQRAVEKLIGRPVDWEDEAAAAAAMSEAEDILNDS